MNRQAAGPPPVGTRPTNNDKALVVYQEVRDTFAANKGREARALQAMFRGDKELSERFLGVAFSMLAKNSSVLQKASVISIVQSIKDAASAGLEIDGQEGAIVEYGGVAQFQPMYRGYLKRIRNSGKVDAVDAQIVYERDHWEEWYDDRGGHFKHVPYQPDRDDPNGRGFLRLAYAYAVTPTGFTFLVTMSEAEINEIRDRYSRAFRGQNSATSPWATSYGEMARKTVIRRLAKYLPGEAVDVLLLMDQANDDAPKVLAPSAPPRQEDLDMRELAMRATGAVEALQDDAETEPEQSATPEVIEAQRPSESVSAGVARVGDDDLIRQAMEMNRRGTQER